MREVWGGGAVTVKERGSGMRGRAVYVLNQLPVSIISQGIHRSEFC